MSEVNVLCIKWGTKFPAYYVNRLYAGVTRGLVRPFRFICFTEDAAGINPEVEVLPLPEVPFEDQMVEAMTTGRRRGAWRKVTLTQPGLAGIEGTTLIMDLDVVVTGSLDSLFDYSPGKICMAREWRYKYHPLQPVGGHGSVYRFDPGVHDYLYNDFASDVEGSLNFLGEQKYISLTAHKYGDLDYYPENWIRSFKRHAIPSLPLNLLFAPTIPQGCNVLCFHGDPKMEEAIVGAGSKLRYKTRPSKWLREYWLEEHEQDWMPGELELGDS